MIVKIRCFQIMKKKHRTYVMDLVIIPIFPITNDVLCFSLFLQAGKRLSRKCCFNQYIISVLYPLCYHLVISPFSNSIRRRRHFIMPNQSAACTLNQYLLSIHTYTLECIGFGEIVRNSNFRRDFEN